MVVSTTSPTAQTPKIAVTTSMASVSRSGARVRRGGDAVPPSVGGVVTLKLASFGRIDADPTPEPQVIFRDASWSYKALRLSETVSGDDAHPGGRHIYRVIRWPAMGRSQWWHRSSARRAKGQGGIHDVATASYRWSRLQGSRVMTPHTTGIVAYMRRTTSPDPTSLDGYLSGSSTRAPAGGYDTEAPPIWTLDQSDDPSVVKERRRTGEAPQRRGSRKKRRTPSRSLAVQLACPVAVSTSASQLLASYSGDLVVDAVHRGPPFSAPGWCGR